MTVAAGTFLTFAQIGAREDLSDMIWDISPTDTPFSTRAGKKKGTARSHDWQTDSLATAASNAALEGDAFVSVAVTPTVRLENIMQISTKSIEISGTADAVLTAGRNEESVYQIMKAGKALKRDMEFVLTSNQATAAGSSTVARLLIPLVAWYKTNVIAGAGGGAPTLSGNNPSTGRTDGTQVALTEANVKLAMQEAYIAGGHPNVLMCGAFQRGVISGFAGPTGTIRTQDADRKVLTASVSVYDSDFGELDVVANIFQRARDVHILDMELWSVVTLRPFQVIDQAKLGDTTKAEILCEFTLESSNEAGSALIADCSTS